MGELQYVEVSVNGEFEQSQMVIEGVDEGFYKAVYIHPTNLDADPWISDTIAANAPANDFKTSIEGWYSDTFGSSISVTLEKFDSRGNEIDEGDDETNWFKSIYTITLNKYIEGKSLSSMMVIKSDT